MTDKEEDILAALIMRYIGIGQEEGDEFYHFYLAYWGDISELLRKKVRNRIDEYADIELAIVATEG